MIDVQIPDLARVRAKLTPALLRDPAARIISDGAKFTQREAKSGIPDGVVARSITVEIHTFEAKIHGSNAAMVAEFGRHPGTASPPWRVLRDWARAHGLEGLEVPIARAISQRGIRGRFFMRAAVAKLRATEAPRLVARAAKEIQAKWSA